MYRMQRTKLHHNKKQEKRPRPVGAGEVLPEMPETHAAPRDKVTKPVKQAPPVSRFPVRRPNLGFLKRQGSGFSFARDIVAELKRVTWPTWPEARRLTAIVIAVSFAVGVMLGLVDFIFYWIINSVILR